MLKYALLPLLWRFVPHAFISGLDLPDLGGLVLRPSSDDIDIRLEREISEFMRRSMQML